MKRSTVIIIVLALVAIGAATAYRMWNKPHEKVEDEEGIAITATELCSKFAADEAGANTAYLTKALEVSGTATQQEKNQDGALVITLQGDNPDLSVLCTMRDKDAAVESGKAVTIKGKCSGNDMFGVLLTDCIVNK